MKLCLACPSDNNTKPISEFYLSKNPMHGDNKLPWCKECIKKHSTLATGEIDEDKFKNVLRQIDRPFYRDVLQSAVNQFKKEHSYVAEKEVKYFGGDIVGLYFKNINTLRQVANKSYGDSEKDGFILKQAVDLDAYKKMLNINPDMVEKHTYDIGDFEVTDDMKMLFGDGYTIVEYKKMFDKYEKLKINYVLQTNIHQEALATYVRFKVKEEDATAKGNVDEANKWYNAAQNAAERAKLTPRQLSKEDLQGGMVNFSDIFTAVESAKERIKIFPEFKYQPRDAADFIIWNYVNYERNLNNMPEVPYSDIYKFYDEKKKEYIEMHGDPYGIFTEDTTESNRETIERFITVPSEFRDGD